MFGLGIFPFIVDHLMDKDSHLPIRKSKWAVGWQTPEKLIYKTLAEPKSSQVWIMILLPDLAPLFSFSGVSLLPLQSIISVVFCTKIISNRSVNLFGKQPRQPKLGQRALD